MAIDMGRIVVGSRVKFKCGGVAEVETVAFGTNDVYLKFVGGEFDVCYSREGLHTLPLLNIVEIEPPAFTWDKVKYGMAFIDKDGDRLIYIAPNVFDKRDLVFSVISKAKETYLLTLTMGGELFNSLKRTPEHDKEGL